MKFLAWIAAVLLLLLAMVVALPFSAVGTRALLGWVNDAGLLRIEYAGGSLFGDLELQMVALDVGDVALQLDRIDTRLDLDCFWRSTFCFEALAIGSLTLDVAAAESDVQSSSDQPQLIEIPFFYEIQKLSLGEALVRWPGGSWRQGQMSAELRLAGSELQIMSASVAEPVLEVLSDTADSQGYAGFEPAPIFIPLDLTISRLELNAAHAVIGDLQQSIDQLVLSGRWQGYALALDELAVTAATIGHIRATGTLNFDGAWPTNINAEIAVAKGVEPAAVAGRVLDVALNGDLGGLDITVGSAGQPALNLALTADLLSAGLPHQGTVDLEWAEGATLGAILDLAGQWSTLEVLGPIHAQVQGTLDKQQVVVSGRASGLGYDLLSFQTVGDWSAPRLNIESMTLQHEGSDSLIRVQGFAEFADSWALQAAFNSQGFTLPSLQEGAPDRFSGELGLQASGSGSNWQVRWQGMDLKGTVNGLPATASGSAGLDSELHLLPGATHIQLNGALLDVVAQENNIEQAQLSLQLDDLGRWFAGARGQISLQGQGTLGREKIRVAGEARNITVGGVDIDLASLSISYDGDSQQFAASVLAPTLESQGYELRNLSLNLQGNLDSHRLQLASEGDIAGRLLLAGAWNEDSWRGELQPAQIQTSSGPWSLSEKVALSWNSPGTLTMAGHCWRHSEFSLCAQDAAVGQSGDISLKLDGDVKAFNGMLPKSFQVGGKLTSTLDLAWQPELDLEIDAVLQARELSATRRYGMGERVSVSWQAIDLTMQRQGSELAVDGTVVRDGRKVLSLNVLLPTTSEGPLSGKLSFNELQLMTLAPWLTELSELGGSLTGDLSLAGTPMAPLARGNLTLTNAQITLVSNPTRLTELALDLQLEGDKAKLTGTGMLGGGALQLQGQVMTQPQLRVELAISGEQHQILLPPASEILVSQDLVLVLADDLLDVSGDVQVHEGVLRHQELPAGSVGLSAEVVVVDVLGNVIEEERPFDVRADIWLHVRDRFRVEGGGVGATLGGKLHIVQEPGEEPQVFGGLNLLGGELEAYGQRLQIRRGTIAFSGPADNPELDISAEREIRSDDVTVGARLLGSLEEPILEVYSDPPMSQGEAMSYLVRGRGMDAGAGADGTALALSMGASVVNRSGIVSGLNRLPLISDVAFGASGGEDDTAATVSGYIGSRLYLSYGRGLYEPINELTARLYLQSRLWLEVVSRLENSLDLYYSFDID
ncbi:MAG: translocation/assembly module TamB domain-containing protein [Halioglobus sp.]